MSKKIRWGILSTARIGEKAVVPAIQVSNNGKVVAVASRNLDNAQAYAERCNIPKAYGSYEELLADPDIDAIYNPLPNSLHHEWTIRCAQAGKPTLCEKPLASNANEAQEMVAAFQEHDLLLAEAFMYRFHPQTQTVKQMIEDGAVGTVQLVQANFNFLLQNEANIRLNADLAGGSLMDVGCYCVNIIRYLLGEEPAKVQAFADIGQQSQVDERLVGIMSFPSGALAHFDSSLRTHRTETYEVRGTQGRILVEKAFLPNRNADGDLIIRYWKSDPDTGVNTYEEIIIDNPNQYTLMVEDFADALLNNRPPKFPIEDSIAQMQAIDMLYASLE